VRHPSTGALYDPAAGRDVKAFPVIAPMDVLDDEFEMVVPCPCA
jgi:hypothetical protein